MGNSTLHGSLSSHILIMWPWPLPLRQTTVYAYIYLYIHYYNFIFFSAVLLQQCQCTGASYWIHWWRKVNQLGVGYRVGFLFCFNLLLVLLLILSCFSFYFIFFLIMCVGLKNKKTLMVTHVTYKIYIVWCDVLQ